MRLLTSVLVDEIILSKYVTCSTDVKGLKFNQDYDTIFIKHRNSVFF